MVSSHAMLARDTVSVPGVDTVNESTKVWFPCIRLVVSSSTTEARAAVNGTRPVAHRSVITAQKRRVFILSPLTARRDRSCRIDRSMPNVRNLCDRLHIFFARCILTTIHAFTAQSIYAIHVRRIG